MPGKRPDSDGRYGRSQTPHGHGYIQSYVPYGEDRVV